MKVALAEVGDRPLIATPARLNAPQGAKVLADLMSEVDWIDYGRLTLDWTGDAITPVLIVEASKVFPRIGSITMDPWYIDIEDAFGQDHMTNEGLRNIVDIVEGVMREKMLALQHEGKI